MVVRVASERRLSATVAADTAMPTCGQGLLGSTPDSDRSEGLPLLVATTTHPRYAPQKLDGRVALLEKVHWH